MLVSKPKKSMILSSKEIDSQDTLSNLVHVDLSLMASFWFRIEKCLFLIKLNKYIKKKSNETEDSVFFMEFLRQFVWREFNRATKSQLMAQMFIFSMMPLNKFFGNIENHFKFEENSGNSQHNFKIWFERVSQVEYFQKNLFIFSESLLCSVR